MAGETLLEVMRQAAAQAIPKEGLTDVMFGKVLSSSPLTISVEGRFEIDESLLIVSPFCRDLSIEIPIPPHGHTAHSAPISIPAHRHSMMDDANKETTENEEIEIKPDITISEYAGEKVKVTVWEGLQPDDNVALLRVASGQQYIALFRVGG